MDVGSQGRLQGRALVAGVLEHVDVSGQDLDGLQQVL